MKKKQRRKRNSNSNAKKEEKDDELEFPKPKQQRIGFFASIRRSFCRCFRSILPSKQQRNDKRLQNRMKLCILAVCLMWATSLKVAVYVASYAIKVPPVQVLYESCKSAYNIAIEEKEKYTNCIRVQLDQCKNDLHNSIVMEVRRVNSTSEMNTDLILHAKDSYQECVSDYTSLRFSFEAWVSAGQSLPLNSKSCSDLEQEQIMNTVGDINLIRSEALALSEEYGHVSQNTVKRIASYAKARAAYDGEYLNNRTKGIQDDISKFISETVGDISVQAPNLEIDDLFEDLLVSIEGAVSCISPRHPQFGKCASNINVFGTIQQALTGYRNILRIFIDALNDIYEKFIKYKQNVQSAYAISSGFYYAVKDAWAVSWIWGDVNVGTFLPIDIPIPPMPEWTGMYDAIPELNDFFDLAASPSYAKLLNSVDAVRDGVHQAIDGFRDEIQFNLVYGFPDMLPEDYEPPQYIGGRSDVRNLASEEELHDNVTKNFVTRSNAALDAFSNLTTNNFPPEDDEIEMPSVNITSVQNRISNVDLSFESLMKPSLDFDLWFLKFASVSEMIFLLDFVLRIYLSIRMFFRYWDSGSIKLPEVDVRTQKEIRNPFKMSNGRLIILLFTNPLVGAFLLMVVGAWILSFASSVYTPLYKEFVNGCVPQTGNGTFITSNIYSMSYNLAYQDGTSSLVKGIESFDAERSKQCTSIYAKSASKQNDDMIQLASYAKSLQTTGERMALFEKCTDIDLADTQFQLACCGEIGYDECGNNTSIEQSSFICPMDARLNIPHSSPGDYFTKNSCDYQTAGSEWDLFDATFDCEVLPSCEVTCTGPHKEKLRRISKECGCITEWFFHSVWLQAIISLMVFALLNASRIGFIDGLARIIWKKLHPGTFTVWATCDNKGKFLAQSFHPGSLTASNDEIPSQSIRLNQEVRKQIDWNSFVFQMGGAVLMIMALSLNVPWVMVVLRSPDVTRPKWIL